MRYWDYGTSLVLLAMLMVSGALFAVANGAATDLSFRGELGRAAFIQRESPEATSQARNDRLNELFREFITVNGGQPMAELVQRFNALLKEQQLSNFDDFLAAMTRPVVYVPDRDSGAQVPVFGPLGSDIINPWLAAAAVIERRPLDEQPMYRSAVRVLRENLDFALIGLEDPNLSLELLPVELHDRARSAYARLNPTNKFGGGFDHPLFYCVVREAAEVFFRDDYPRARLTMAELVVPVAEGGFGIESCLLCHERDHSGVYRRLLGQGSYLLAKAEELRKAREQGATSEEDPSQIQAEADNFLLAAERVLRAFPDRIDEAAVRQSLVNNSSSNLERLKPGYDDFVAVLESVGCLQCHSSEADVSEELNPASYGAFVLDRNAYNKSANVQAIGQLIDFDNVAQSLLINKAANLVDHEGAARIKLDKAEVEALSRALAKWLGSFSEGVGAPVSPASPAGAVPSTSDRSIEGDGAVPQLQESLRTPQDAATHRTGNHFVLRTATQERPSAPQPQLEGDLHERS